MSVPDLCKKGSIETLHNTVQDSGFLHCMHALYYYTFATTMLKGGSACSAKIQSLILTQVKGHQSVKQLCVVSRICMQLIHGL